jgi:sugar/nucleoside kinase (ribokinase family)
LQNTLEVIKDYAIFSPNLLEMQSLLSLNPTLPATPNDVEVAARMFWDMSMRRNGASPIIVLRAGEMGSYTLDSDGPGLWVPAYWRKEEQDRVVDPTGGGNAFCGGLCAGLLLCDGDVRKGGRLHDYRHLLADKLAASVYASTAASFTIEQRGLPRLRVSEGKELWNDEDPWDRLKRLAARMRT